MKILVTGALGFVGKNLCAQLENIRDGKLVHYDNLKIDNIFKYDINCTLEQLDNWCSECDFVFHLAGVNRPKKEEEFMSGNLGITDILLNTLKKYGNKCPIMISSSIQATLTGRFGASEYGKSKRAVEDLAFKYGEETGAQVFVYRFPNLFGKWCRPNYNSVVATFCYNIARGLPINVHNRDVEMELLYIDDLVDEMVEALRREVHRCEFNGVQAVYAEHGQYCYCPKTYLVTVGEIVDMLYFFAEHLCTLTIPEMRPRTFSKALYSTFLSYVPKEKISSPLKMHKDIRGSFTELIHFDNCGQVSVNISKPGVTKGQHWHNTKWEFFIVVSGHGLIQQRKMGTDEILDFEVFGENMQCVRILPGYVHNIINLSQTDNLITVMYCNEVFDAEKPDTFYLPV